MDPQINMRGLMAVEIWCDDQIHPKEEIYSLPAEGVLEVEKSCSSGHAKRKQREPDWDNNNAETGEKVVRGRADRGSQGSRSYSSSYTCNSYTRHDKTADRGSEGGRGGGRGPRGSRGWGGDRGGRGGQGGGSDIRRGGGGGRGGRGGRYPGGGW